MEFRDSILSALETLSSVFVRNLATNNRSRAGTIWDNKGGNVMRGSGFKHWVWTVTIGLVLWPSILPGEIANAGALLDEGPRRLVRTRPITDGATTADAADEPTLVSPPDGALGVTPPVTLRALVTDPDLDFLDVTFFGRPAVGPPREDFTLVHMTDTQYYAQSNPATFSAITQWVRDNRETYNIAFVAFSGDIVNVADQIFQWENADAAMSTYEVPIPPDLPDGIPYGVAPGNHDQSPNGNPDGTSNYNLYFGINRFFGRPYYGGNYNGFDNDNNYQIFSGGGMDFIVVHLEYDTVPDVPVLEWADALLQANSGLRAIVVSHFLMELGEQAPFGNQGAAVFEALKGNPNLFLMLAGHRHGEGKRIDVVEGRTIYTLVADYQDEPNQGNGWIRLLEFSPTNDKIYVSTYSPTLDQFQVDADSQFVLDYEMDAGPPFVELGTLSGVGSGSEAAFVWPNLEPSEAYEWYVEVSDGTTVTTGPIWGFTTACSSAVECDDGNACTLDSCADGTCVHSLDDLAPCDDGDACTISDECTAGGCAGIEVSCPAGQSCEPESGLCVAVPLEVTFRQGALGYSGTRDTFLDSSAPNANMSSATPVIVDRSPEKHLLMRFEGLFVSEGGPIPDGSEILSGRLTINVTNESQGVGASLHRMQQPWNDTDGWTDWGSGIQADGTEAASTADASSSSGTGLHAIDVTTSLAAWAAGEPNHGWAWLPPVQDNSWQFDSAEGALPPLLEVTYQVSCVLDADCDDGNPCSGVEFCVAGGCLPGTPIDCGAQLCDPVDASCVDCVSHADCDDGDLCNGLEICNGLTGGCLGGAPLNCDDGLGCTDDACDASLGCLFTDNCPAGEVCEPASESCEPPPAPTAGDLIIAGFQPNGAMEFLELFNTTRYEIALDSLEILERVDNDADGVVELDWQLSADLTGRTIKPYSFFLIAEPGVTPGPADLEINMALSSQEGGSEERAIGLELRVDGVHMDHLLYGRHDGSTPPGEIPPGDISFVSFGEIERTEVIRTVTGTPPIASFSEGVTQRLTAEDLYAGYDVEGFYTDESSLPGDFPAGVWTSNHSPTGAYQARGSSAPSVLPPGCIPPEVEDLALEHTNETTLAWGAQAADARFDVASGTLLLLHVGGGTGSAHCLANDVNGESLVDPRPSPDLGEGFYYLVRAQTECGPGTYGYSGPDERTVSACP
jgi:hypothetical protein